MSMLQANQRHVTHGARRGAGWRRVAWIALLLAALVLAGCADDEGDRRFATDPRTPQPTAARTPSPTAPAEMPPPARPKASPEALVDRRGAPDAAWWLADGTVWLVGDGEPLEIVADGALAIAPGPGGNLAAVLSMRDRAYQIDIYDRDGRRTDTFDDVLRVPAGPASPVASPAAPSPGISLEWSPQGNRILLGHPSGALIDVALDGGTTEIETRVPLTGLERAAWSPRGDAIAVLARDPEGVGSLALVEPSPDKPAGVSVIAPVGQAEGRAKSVEAFDWKPRGDGIVFIEAQRGDAGPIDGMVVGWDRATNSTQILATGGQGGPTGSVTWLSVAPDGKAVAYIVMMQGGEDSSFVGLFVRSMVDGQLYRVPVDADATVLRAWWLRDGLAWVSVAGDPEAGAETRVVFIDGEGERSLLGTLPAGAGATPVASPAASPVAIPDASPVAVPASPAASPDASPAATPAG